MKNKYQESFQKYEATSLMNSPESQTCGLKGIKQIIIGLVLTVAMMASHSAFAAVPVVDNATGASDITSNSAILNGTLTSTGSLSTQVHVYWGVTDGDTVIVDWDFTADMGILKTGPLSLAVTDLAPNTTYYYRFYATNLDGEVWAGTTESFLTPAVAGPLPVNLGETSHFTILAGAAVTYPGAGIINGDVGASPISGAAISIPPAQVNGIIYKVDAAGPAGPNVVIDPVLLTAAKGDLTIAYNDARDRVPVPAGPFLDPGVGNIGGLVLVPGLYKFTGEAHLEGADVTLMGGPDDVWIFQIATALIVEAGVNRSVILAGGARAKNIFWQVGTSATLGTTSSFKGTIIADQSITMDVGSTLEGRALAFSAGITFGGDGGSLPPENNAPVAAPDTYIAYENITLTVAAPGLLANDSDADGNPLTAVKVTDPAHGILTLNADGSLTYEPTADYNGPDSFTYKANDGLLDSNTVTVTLTVNPTFTLTVVNGTGSGIYTDGTFIPVIATIPVGKVFNQWIGDIANLVDPVEATLVLMPAADVTVTAEFINAPIGTFTLTVINGTGGGSYEAGTAVAISAIVSAGKVFDTWSGDIANLTDAASAATIATMPAGNITVTADSVNVPINSFTLAVVNGTGDGSYTSGTAVAVTAVVPEGMVFDRWQGDIGYMADSTAQATIATMPDSNISVTAIFTDAPPATFTLTVVNGTGSGSYAAGTAVAITATVPEGDAFEIWAGDIANLADETEAATIATMPAANITVTAMFMDTPVSDQNMYLARMRGTINWKKHAIGISDDRLIFSGQINPSGIDHSLSGASIVLSVGDVQLLPAVNLNSRGYASGVIIEGISYKFHLNWMRGIYSFNIRGLDLRAATGIPNVTGKTILDLPMSVTVNGVNLDIPVVLGTFESPCRTIAGKYSIFTFNIHSNSTLSGLYNCNRIWVWEDGIKLRSVIEAEGGGPIVPTGDIIVTTGNATMVVPFEEIVFIGDHRWYYKSNAPGVNWLAMNNRHHTFHMRISGEPGIGVPPIGPGQPSEHQIQIQFQIPTTDGVMTFDSNLEVLRINNSKRTWNR